MNPKDIKWFAMIIAVVLMISVIGSSALAASTLTFPSSLETIEVQAFYGDTSLDEVELQDTVTRIESQAFANSSLKKINLPASVTYIADDAFQNCDSVIATITPDSYAQQYCIDQRIAYIYQENSTDYMMQYHEHIYQLVKGKTTWENAKTACEQAGGHLLTINTEGEQKAIETLLKEHGAEHAAYWTGMKGPSEGGTWEKWITGEKADYTHWGMGEPGQAGGEGYGAIYTGSNSYGGWNYGDWGETANDCDIADGYICEWGYQSTYRALLIGEYTFLEWKMIGSGDDQEVQFYISTAQRNVGDVDNIASMLDSVYGHDGFGKYEITKKTDLHAKDIQNAIQSTFADTKDYDVSLFFIASHGNNYGDGEIVMPFLGDVENIDEAYAYYDDNLLPFSTLASWMTQYIKGEVIVILESCGAGSAIYSADEQNSVTLRKDRTENKEEITVDFAEAAIQAFSKADPGMRVYSNEPSKGDLANSTGDLRIPKYYVLACSRHGELSWGNLYYNYFTHWLIEGVGSSGNSPADINPKDNAVTLTELYDYIKQYDGVYNQHVQRYPVNSQFKLFRFK